MKTNTTTLQTQNYVNKQQQQHKQQKNRPVSRRHQFVNSAPPEESTT